MAKTVRFHQIGGPENLKIEDVPIRAPGNGEVKLRVKAVGLNRAESMYYHGRYLEQTVVPSGIGYEASGTVEAVGAGVDSSLVGKEVATMPGFSMGKYAVLGEEAIVPENVLTDYPKNLSPTEAAAVWMQYTTAYGALVHLGHVADEDFVVIPAASSSVGLAAIQITKAQGATAIAVSRNSKKRDELLSLGADHVIASQEEDFVKRVKEITAGAGARVTFDPVAGSFVEKLAEAASSGSIIFEYGGLSMEPTPFPLVLALRKGIAIRGYTLHEITNDKLVLERAKRYINDRLADGRFKPKIDKVFPFAETVQAYQYLESNVQVGKIVIKL
jgi:NADPH:quinone reductase-like Zn-dependent oxidoreductase